MKNYTILLIVCMIMITYSCENNSYIRNEDSCFQFDISYENEYHIVNKWILLGFLHSDTEFEECTPDNLSGMNIEFSDNNRFHAISSCNTFDGYFKISSPDVIIIDSVATTLRGCIIDNSEVWEEKYYNELKNASNYKINGDKLTIETTSNIDIIFRADMKTN